MALKRGVVRGRTPDERGSALIEAAFVVPVILILIAGIIEYGFLFRTASITNTSTRSGARLAAANYGAATSPGLQTAVIDNVRLSVEKDLSSRQSSDTPVDLWIYKADANGNPQSGDFSSCGTECFTYTWNSGTKQFGPSPSGSWASPLVCGDTHDNVGVFVRLTHKAVGFSSVFPTFTVKEKTIMRLEPPASCPTGT